MNGNWKQYLDEIIEPDDITIKGFAAKDELQPEIWDNDKQLKDYIAEHLYRIAKIFFEGLDLDWKKVKDVVITGSLANYNWSRYSDIDLHILVDPSDFNGNENILDDYFKKASQVWNKTHNIKVKGHLVEIYVQDHKEVHHSTGVYSLKYDKWVKRPSKHFPKIDYINIKKKAAKLMNDIDEVYEMFVHKDYKLAYDEAEKMREKIRNFRKAGLEKGGEYSVENLTFKVLRRNDYLQKLSSLKILSYDKMMSVNGGISSEIIKIKIEENN